VAETHYAKVIWSGGSGPTKSVADYSREFRAEFEGKPPIHGSADPAFRGDPPLYNPEDLLMSALSACHMLSYLAVCAHAGIAVVSYEDSVVGTVARRGYEVQQQSNYRRCVLGHDRIGLAVRGRRPDSRSRCVRSRVA
jgi:organic hydroperoxide reductase OsmC/OhrA